MSIFVFLFLPFDSKSLYFAFLNIHRWINIADIAHLGLEDGSVEPKRYSVDFQRLIKRKGHRHAANEGMDSYR